MLGTLSYASAVLRGHPKLVSLSRSNYERKTWGTSLEVVSALIIHEKGQKLPMFISRERLTVRSSFTPHFNRKVFPISVSYNMHPSDKQKREKNDFNFLIMHIRLAGKMFSEMTYEQ